MPSEVNDFAIKTDENGRSRLFINGKELHHVTKYQVSQDADEDSYAHVDVCFDVRGDLKIEL